MKIRKLFWLFILPAFSPGIFAQQDSTDLLLVANEPQPLSMQDSMYLVNSDLIEIELEFSLDTTFQLGKISIELIQLSPYYGPILLIHEEYTSEDLIIENLINGSEVSYSFGLFSSSLNYEVAVRLEDSEGQQVRLITKILVP